MIKHFYSYVSLGVMLCLITLISMGCSRKAIDKEYLAQQYLKHDETGKAIKIYKEVIKQNLATEVSYHNLGNIFSKQRDFKQAENVLLNGLRRYPKSSAINLSLMNVYFEKKDYEKGIEQYKSIYSLPKVDIDVYIWREVIDEVIKQKKLDEEGQMAFFDEILNINPRDLIVLERKGNLLVKTRKYDDAKNYFFRILELDKKNSYAYSKLGTCYFNLGNYEEAYTNYKKAESLGEHIPKDFLNRLKEKDLNGRVCQDQFFSVVKM